MLEVAQEVVFHLAFGSPPEPHDPGTQTGLISGVLGGETGRTGAPKQRAGQTGMADGPGTEAQDVASV